MNLDLIYEYALYYAIGATIWTLILGYQNESMTWARTFGVVIWPIPAIHFIGQLLSKLVGKMR